LQEAKGRKRRLLMFNISSETANFGFDISNFALLIGAILVGVGTYGVFEFGKIKEHFSNERISTNETETARAKEGAAKAEEEAAKANARAAEATQKAEVERVERLRLELKLAPRSLTPAESQELSNELTALHGVNVDVVSYESMGFDVADLARQIAGASTLAHINVNIFTPFGGNGMIKGIFVRTEVGSDNNIEAAANLLVSALKKAGLNADRSDSYPIGEPLSNAYNGPTGITPSAKIRILICGKP
jgi:hypothetical protein